MKRLLVMAATVLAMAPIPAAASSGCPFVNHAYCAGYDPVVQPTPTVPACNTVDRFATICYVDAPRATLYPESRAIEFDDGSAQWTEYATEASVQHGLVMRCLHEWQHTQYQASPDNQLLPGLVVDEGWVYCEPMNP